MVVGESTERVLEKDVGGEVRSAQVQCLEKGEEVWEESRLGCKG